MKINSFLLRFSLALVLTLLAVALAPSGYAQQSQPRQSDEDQNSTAPRKTDPATLPPQQPQQTEGQIPASGETTTQEAKSFSGNIVKENGELVLKDPVTKVTYKLDNSAKAKQYLGKQVKVTGKLE